MFVPLGALQAPFWVASNFLHGRIGHKKIEVLRAPEGVCAQILFPMMLGDDLRGHLSSFGILFQRARHFFDAL